VGVLAPIVFEHLARHVPIARLLLLGQSRNPAARTGVSLPAAEGANAS
jgi:hypothetical protein